MKNSEFIRISESSGFKFESEEFQKFQSEFELILRHIGNIDKLSTEDLEPLYHLNAEHYLREDRSDYTGDASDDLLENSPNKKGKYIEFKK